MTKDMFSRIKLVLTDPTKFFKGIKSEKGIKTAFGYFAIMFLVLSVLSAIVALLFGPAVDQWAASIFNFEVETQTTSELLMGLVFAYPLGLLMSFVGAGLLHLWIWLFGGREVYAKTYQLMTYAKTPEFIFGWIPVVNLFTWIWGLILLVIGTHIVHKVSMTRSIVMYVVPFALLFVLGALLLVFAAGFMANMGQFGAAGASIAGLA